MKTKVTERISVVAVCLFIVLALPASAVDTITTNQLGQGVVYKHYHYDNLYSSLQEVFVTDVNLSDPAVSMRIRYQNPARLTTSGYASSTPGAAAAINGTFLMRRDRLTFLKSTNHHQCHTTGSARSTGHHDDGFKTANSINIVVRPGPGWASLTTSNVIACGPDLVQEGAKVTNYDFADPFITGRNPRTCAGTTTTSCSWSWTEGPSTRRA